MTKPHRPNIKDPSLHGQPAPDLCRFLVVFDANGDIRVTVDEYTENTYAMGYAIKTGKENGKLSTSKKSLCGIDISHHYLTRGPNVSGERHANYLIHPRHTISCEGWGYLDEKESLIDGAKERIRLALVELIDEAKERLVKLMHSNDCSDEKSYDSPEP